MADIAQLGIAVDTSQTKLAARELDNLAAAGTKAEGSTKKLGSTSKQAMEQAAAATAKAQQTMERMLAAQERQEKLMEQMAREMQQLTQALQGNASANNAAAHAAQNAAQALGQESAAAKSAQAAAQGHAQAATSAAAASGAMGAQATATGGALGGMASKVLATATAVLSLGKIISEMDAWTNMNNRIRLVTEGQEQFATAQANIINIAKSTNQPLAETAELYQRLAMNQKTLGLSVTELSGIVKTISQTMVIGGSSAAGGAAALMQLGQAFNSGVLRGEEFNSVMEQAPGLMQAIAAGMGKTVGEMRALAEAGKITTDELVKALQKQAATVDADYGKMSKTVEQSMTNVKTSFTEFVGRADEATGVSKALSTAINGVAANIGPLATIAATLVGVGLATWIGSAAAASGGLAVALGGVAAASTGLLAAMGPAGWLILGVGAAATAWQLLGSKASTAGAQMSSAGEQAAAAGNKLVAGIVPAINTAIGAYDKMIAKQKESMGIAKTPIDDAAKALKEADLNLQKLAQQVARAQQGSGEYVNMGPKQRAAAEKALTDELEKASKKRGELAAKEAEYNGNAVTLYVQGKERQTEASAKLLKMEEAKAARDKALAAAGADRAQQEKVNAAYRIELAKIEEDASKKSAKSSVEAGENEVASIRARVKAVQANIAALQEYGAAAEKQTDGDRMVLKIQEELAGGIKGVARANKEKALAAAESLASAQKEEQAIKSQIELQKKQEEEYRKTIQAMSDVAEKTEQQAIGIEAQNEAYGRSKTAIEQQVLASKKLQLQRLEELGLTGDYTKALGLQIAAQERLVDALAASDYKKMSEHTDKLLSNANAQAALYADELELTGLTAVERAKVVAQRQVELKYAKEIDEVNRSNLSTDEKQAQLRKIAEAQQIESSAAVNKVIQDDFARTSEQINNSLTDALLNAFEGGKNAAQGVKEAIVKMFNDMVLRPVISAIVNPVGQAVSGAVGSFGNAAAGQAGTGLLGSLASSTVGTFFSSITTAVSAGFKGATLGVGMMGPTTAGAGGAMGFGNALAAIPGWGWALAGIAALAGLGIGKTPGEQHAGGLFSTSGSVGMDAAMRVTGGGGWDDGAWARDLVKRADGAINQSLTQVGEGLVQTFAQINELAGGLVSEFDLTLGFAANLNGEGKDKNAFGYFDLTDKTTGEVITSYQNRELGTDNQAAMAKLSDDAARAMLDALAKANVPQWAQNVLKDLESVPGLQAMQEFLAYPQKLADSFGIAKQSMADDIATGFTSGDGEAAGAALANTVLSGIQSSIVGAASQQISTLVTNMILTPILSALATAQDPAAAIAGIDFDAVIARAGAMGEGLANALNNPAFQGAMSKLDTVLQQVGQSAVGAAGDLQLIAQSADAVAAAPAPVPAPVPAPTPAQASSGGGGGGARDIPVGGFVDPNVYQIDLTDIAQQTADALDKIAESIKNLGKVTPQAYAAIDEQARQKFSELNGDYLAGLVDFGEQSRAQYVALGKIGAEIQAVYNTTGPWSQIPTGPAEELIEKLRQSAELPAGMIDQLYAEYGTDYKAFFESLSSYVTGLGRMAWQASEGLEGNQDELDALNQQIKEWTLAQKRLLATDELVSLATEAADATAKIEELKRTGGLTDPITQLKELYAKKLTDIDAGINAALQAEIDQKKGTAADYADYSTQLDDFLKNGRGQFGTQQEYEDFIAKGKEIMGDSFMGAMDGGANPWPEILQKMINELNTDVSAMTAEQQSYIKGLEDWYAVQKELLATEMLVDINKQITALEAEEKGPLTTIKDAIQKYADDFEELGTLTDDVQARLDKMEGLQLEKARNALYDQLLTPEEVTANAKAKLKTDFGGIISTALGETMMGSIESQMMGGGVPQGSEELITLLQGVGEEMPTTTASFRALIDSIDTSTTSGQNLRDSLLELVPGFVSLQGAADGATDALTPLEEVEKAFAALERAINAEKEALRTAFDARMEVLQKELAIAQERAGIENQAIKLLGRSKELRAAELSAMDASNRGLKQRIWAVEDASENVDKALSTLQRSVAAQKASVSESAQAQIDAINAGAEARQKAVDDAQKSVQDLTGIFEEITNAIKTMRGNAQDEAMRMEQARAYISMALSVAQAGGTIDQKRLSEAMATVTSDTAETYAAGADYRFAQARQAAELQKLADVTGGQKDVAQATLDAALAANQTAQDQIKAITEARDSQLKALDNQLKTAQDAVSVMRGVDLSVLGVGDAVTALDTAMAAYEVERARLGAEQLFTGQIQVTLLEKQIEQEQANFDAQIEALDSQLEIAQSQLDALRGVDNSVKSVASALSAFASAQAVAAAAQAAAATPASGGAITYDGPQGPGLYVNGGLTGGVRPKPVPSYDVGTNYVPRDTLAMVHEGEAIVPKAFNPAAFSGAKSDDVQLASLVVSLTAEVQRLQGIVQAGNADQRRTADAVNGRPEAPMLVETV